MHRVLGPMTVPTAGMTEGAEVGNGTNCLHFLWVQPLQGDTDEHYMTETATNLRLWKIMTHWRPNTGTGRAKQRNTVWVTPTLKVCRVSNKIKRSILSVHDTYRGFLQSTLNFRCTDRTRARHQGWYRFSQGNAKSKLALSVFHLMTQTSRREQKNNNKALQTKIRKMKSVSSEMLNVTTD